MKVVLLTDLFLSISKVNVFGSLIIYINQSNVTIYIIFVCCSWDGGDILQSAWRVSHSMSSIQQ